MGWCTTTDPERFVDAAGGYLGSRAAENTLLLSAVQAARTGWRTQVIGPQGTRHPDTAPAGTGLPGSARADPGRVLEPAVARGSAPGGDLLFGWWEPPDGSGPRGAFYHDPAAPLIIAGRVPEIAASLAGTLARMGRTVIGLDAQTEAADAFAAAWSQRERAAVSVHRTCRVYRLTSADADTGQQQGHAQRPVGRPDTAIGGWAPPESAERGGGSGRLRFATEADYPLLADWLAAFGAETGMRIAAKDLAADLISYGGALFWEVAPRPPRIRDAAHHLPIPHHRETAQFGEQERQLVALAAVTRPIAGVVQISVLFTPPECRRNGYAAAMTLAVTRAALAGTVPRPPRQPVQSARPVLPAREVVLIADGNRPGRRIIRFGYQLIGERTVLRFGPPTGPMPRLRPTGPMPRFPTGPLPRLRR